MIPIHEMKPIHDFPYPPGIGSPLRRKEPNPPGALCRSRSSKSRKGKKYEELKLERRRKFL